MARNFQVLVLSNADYIPMIQLHIGPFFMARRLYAHAIVVEPQFAASGCIQGPKWVHDNAATHSPFNCIQWNFSELLPGGHHHQDVGTLGSLGG
jgi:hypothetical protein